MVAGVFSWLLRRRETACRRCPDPRDSHRSYVPGSGKPGFCIACKCGQYKPERPLALALAYLRERPPPLTADVLTPHPVRLPVPDWCDDADWDDDLTRLGIRVAPYAPRPKWGPW